MTTATATIEDPLMDLSDDYPPAVPECDFDLDGFFDDPSEDENVEAATNPVADPETVDRVIAAITDEQQAAMDQSLATTATPITNANEFGIVLEPETKATLDDKPAENWPEFKAPATQSTGLRFEKTIGDGIRELEESISKMCIEENSLKEHLKDLRKDRNELAAELEGLLARIAAGEYRFNPLHREVGESDKPAASVVPTSETTTAIPCPPQAWGRDQIEVLSKHGLTEAKVEALRAASDKGKFDGTIAGLRDWIAKFDLWYRDVKGCGATGASKIGEALTSYVNANPVAEEPMTPEQERLSVEAAEFLGYTKPKDEAKPSEVLGTAIEASMPCNDGTGEHVVEVALPTVSPTVEPLNPTDTPTPTEPKPDAEPSSPPQAKPKRIRKPKAKPIIVETTGKDSSAKPQTIQEAMKTSEFHKSNEKQLAMIDQVMKGGEPIDTSSADDAANLEAAYLAGCEAGARDESCSMNPYPRDSAAGREWQRGLDECTVVAGM